MKNTMKNRPVQLLSLEGFSVLSVFVLFLLVVPAVPFLGSPPVFAEEQVFIDIFSPAFQPLPIAIAPFHDLDPSKGRSDLGGVISAVLTSDLRATGLFRVLDPASFLVDGPIRDPGRIDFRAWVLIGAEVLVQGSFRADDRSVMLHAQIFDVHQGKAVSAKRYRGSPENVRAMAHDFANAVLEQFTGEPGAFDSKIAFVHDGTGKKELYLVDWDGRGLRRLTRNESLNLLPRWSPDARSLLFTSYQGGKPGLYRLEMDTLKETRIPSKGTMNLGGSFSPDGEWIVFSSNREGKSDIFRCRIDGSEVTRLTRGWATNVSPRWSPDGEKILFVSDRSGHPDLHIMDAHGGGVRRLTYEGKYNSSPAWSPKGDRIAYVSRWEDGRFHIHGVDADGTNMRALTYGAGNDEDPSWSPDGRFVVYASTRGEKTDLYVVSAHGGAPIRITELAGSETTPSWSPKK